MNELWREKKGGLLALSVGTVVGCLLFWYLVIRFENNYIDRKRELTVQKEEQIKVARKNAQLVDEMEVELERDAEKLATFERQMAHGDVYLWIINRLQQYRRPYGIDFSEFDPPVIGDLDVFPKVPYKAAKFAIAGTASYFSFGDFLAEFENNFPNMRMLRLELEPASDVVTTNDAPRLAFKMQFMMLVRTAQNRLLEDLLTDPKE